MRRFFTIFFVLVSTGTSSILKADNKDKLVIPYINQPITFDGIVDEDIWHQVGPLPVSMFVPIHDGVPTEQTEMFIAYDDRYMYIAGRLHTRNGARISTVSKKRDTFDPGNDYFGVVFDTFNDNENAVCFTTTPSAARVDFTIFNDAQMSSPMSLPVNPSWNTFWDAKTSVYEDAWHAEIQIPLSSLRFQEKNGKVTMGLVLWRNVASENEIHTFPLMPNEFGEWSMVKPSKAQKVEFENLTSRKPIYITPYVLGGVQQESELSADGSDYTRTTEQKFEPGIDIKYGITSNLTLDLTVNTDFAQVEADDEKLNLTRFDLFFEEKRQFFLERASIFRFNSNHRNTLFYSRRIGLDEDNEEIVPIYGGARMVGRAGSWDIGLLNMQTAETDYLPSTNYGVCRLRKNVINANSYAGGIITSKIDLDGRYNVAYGLDGIFKVIGDDYFSFNYAETYTTEYQNEFLSGKNAKFWAEWEKRSEIGFGYSFSLARSGEEYNPEMGFEMRDDYSRAFTRLWYGWINKDEAPLLKHNFMGFGVIYKNNLDFDTQTIWLGGGWQFQTKNSWTGSITPRYYYDYLEDTFELSDDVVVPVGTYEFSGTELMISTPQNKLFSLMSQIYVGEFYDGTRISLINKLFFKPSSYFTATLDYIFEDAQFTKRDQHFLAHIARIKAELMLSTKLTASVFFQYNSYDDLGIDNVRIRYQPKEGNDLWIVYNDVMNTNRFREVPTLPFSDTRVFIVKYNHTFTLR